MGELSRTIGRVGYHRTTYGNLAKALTSSSRHRHGERVRVLIIFGVMVAW